MIEFTGHCPHCGDVFGQRVLLYKNSYSYYPQIGDFIGWPDRQNFAPSCLVELYEPVGAYTLCLKDPCPGCSNSIVAVVSASGILVGYFSLDRWNLSGGIVTQYDLRANGTFSYWNCTMPKEALSIINKMAKSLEVKSATKRLRRAMSRV